jgi:hypothetical protein
MLFLHSHRQLFYVLLACLSIDVFLANSVTAQESGQQRTAGRIVKVTLYRDQAMVTREVEIAAGKGSDKIVIEGLPTQVNPNSLFAEGDSTTMVRATQFARRPVSSSPDEAISDKQKQIADIQTQQQTIASQQSVLNERLGYLSKLESFVAPTAMNELGHGVLNAETLKSMTEFHFQQRDEIAKEQLALGQKNQELQVALELAQRELASLTSSDNKEAFEAVVFFNRSNDQASTIRLSYLVTGCGWSPSYTLRTTDTNVDSSLEYNAMIHQFSGEDWQNVQLTLSTSSPAISSMRPSLAAHRITLSSEQAQQANTQDVVSQAFKGSIAVQQQAAYTLNNTIDFSGNAKASLTMNCALDDQSILELTTDLGVLKTLSTEQAAMAEQRSITYVLADSVTLNNRPDQQIVRIATPNLPANMYLVATPVLTNLVYRETELANKSQFDLMAGPIGIYLNDQFVGRSEIPFVTRGQKFIVGLGADPQLIAKREVVSRNEETQGGNRRITIRYRLKVENYHNESTLVRLLDRVPLAGDGTDVQIKLAADTPKISEDKIYQEIERPEGVLRWDMEVPGNGESASIEYGYSLEFDRQYSLSNANTQPANEQEFEQRLLRRNRY